MDTGKQQNQKSETISYDCVFTVEIECPVDLINGDPLQAQLRDAFRDAFIRVMANNDGRIMKLHNVPCVVASERIAVL